MEWFLFLTVWPSCLLATRGFPFWNCLFIAFAHLCLGFFVFSELVCVPHVHVYFEIDLFSLDLKSRDTEAERLSMYWFILQMPTAAITGQAGARNLGLTPGLLAEWQVLKYLVHQLVPPKAHVSKKLELEEPGLEPGFLVWDVSFLCTNLPTAPYTYLSLGAF